MVTPDGLLQVFYYDAGLGNLRHAWYNTTIGWHFENLDGDAGSIAGWNANLGYDPAAVIHNNTLQLFYYDATNGNLRHAWNTPGTGWHFENLDGDVGSVAGQDADTGRNTAAVIYGGNLQLFYYDASYGNLRHAWSEPTAGWHFENIEGDSASVSHYDSNVGLMPTATVAGNSLQVFYYDSPGGNLRHAWTSPTIPWSFETLDGSGGQPTGRLDVDVGHDPTVVSYYGHAQLFYYDVTNGNLRHSWSQ